MLIFTLKKEWYEKIKSGEKTVEYREVKDYWTTRLYSTIYHNVAEDSHLYRWGMNATSTEFT